MVWKHNGIGASGSKEVSREQRKDPEWIGGLGTVKAVRLCRGMNGWSTHTHPALLGGN